VRGSSTSSDRQAGHHQPYFQDRVPYSGLVLCRTLGSSWKAMLHSRVERDLVYQLNLMLRFHDVFFAYKIQGCLAL
jgi:hypothetical protein